MMSTMKKRSTASRPSDAIRKKEPNTAKPHTYGTRRTRKPAGLYACAARRRPGVGGAGVRSSCRSRPPPRAGRRPVSGRSLALRSGGAPGRAPGTATAPGTCGLAVLQQRSLLARPERQTRSTLSNRTAQSSLVRTCY